MRNTLFKKGLVVGIIILLVGVSVLSSVSSRYLSVSNKKTINDINEIETSDDYTEIFTFIDAYVYGLNLKGIGPIYYIELWGVDNTIDIQGYKSPLFPIINSHFVVSTDHVIAPQFIGIYYHVTVDTYSVKGIAFGNIEWSW